MADLTPGLEIERKWLIDQLPKGAWKQHFIVHQAYLHVDDDTELRVVVRYRADSYHSVEREPFSRKLTFKAGNGLERKEIQINITQEQLLELQRHITAPFIVKDFYIYDLGERGYHGMGELEVSIVDPGTDNEFMYCEVEFESKRRADKFNPEDIFAGIWSREVTGDNHYQMKEYWRRTRT